MGTWVHGGAGTVGFGPKQFAPYEPVGLESVLLPIPRSAAPRLRRDATTAATRRPPSRAGLHLLAAAASLLDPPLASVAAAAAACSGFDSFALWSPAGTRATATTARASSAPLTPEAMTTSTWPGAAAVPAPSAAKPGHGQAQPTCPHLLPAPLCRPEVESAVAGRRFSCSLISLDPLDFVSV